MKTIYRILLFITIITLMIRSYFLFSINILISLILLIPLLFITHDLYKIEYLLYIYFVQVLGVSCRFYRLPYYDKIMHFLSGMIFVLLGYIFMKKYISKSHILYLIINCIEMSLAFLWEVFEYCGLIFFQYDASHHYTTGVHDTMQDMLISLLGGFVITFVIHKFQSYIGNLYKQQSNNPDSTSQQ